MLLLISVLVFSSAALLALAVSRTVLRRERLRRRYGSLSAPGGTLLDAEEGEPSWITIDPARFGIDRAGQRRLRAELIGAGFFGPSSVPGFLLIRLALLVAVPVGGMLVLPLLPGSWGMTERVALAAVLVAIAYYLPRAYLSRRRRRLEGKYRLVFPDFLDMLVVCINAGLSLDAALDRAAREVDEDNAEFRANLDLMAGEMRAGKGTPLALRSLADRLGLREARSFAALLQQTVELGTDVAQALTTFSDEMRDRRMSSAEEKAAALPPKLTLPLGLFIFPVVLIVVLAPAVLRVLTVAGR